VSIKVNGKIFSKNLFVKKNATETITDFQRQIKIFYESGPEFCGITFYRDRLGGVLSEKQVTRLSDGNKIRPVIGQWKDTDIEGKSLTFDRLSGKLLKVRGYRQTICVVESALALRAINAQISPELKSLGRQSIS